MKNLSAAEAAGLLKTKDNILILTHRRPDGDTIGCAAGLCAALRQAGKNAFLLKNPDITRTMLIYAEKYWAAEDFSPDFVVSVDIAGTGLFFRGGERYLDQIGLAIDHHPSFEGFGAARCVYPEKAACGEIVYEICRELGRITPEIALPLYVAVSTDTGCFQYANTTANTHSVAAALIESGIDYFAVNHRHFRVKSKKRLALEAGMLAGMEFFHEGRGVMMSVSREMMQRLEAAEDDAEDLSSLAGMIEGVDCGVVLRELAPDEWKVSLRTGANGRVNATDACTRLGGGGHAMAAGATLNGSLEDVKRSVLAAIDAVKCE
ncbi:MAG: DHH family phosphoesterase [Oscillospiraceae bacterium]|nr:DHH family phosphoesterase [Oscillospiraceae bacterium]